jgi:hypothetical protein
MIPNRYHNILPVFGKVVAQTLTLHWQYNHKIELQDGFILPFG